MSNPRSIFPIDGADIEEQLYFKMIDEAMERKEDKIISNGKPAHAVYLLNKFLECAKQSVKIYTGTLAQTFDNVVAYADPQMARSAINFLSKENSELSIVIVNEPDVHPGMTINEHPLLKAISEADSEIEGRVDVWRGNPEDWEDYQYHFLVMDDEAFRIEVDTEEAQAYVHFADPGFAKNLSDTFDLFRDRAEHLLSLPAAAR